MKGLLKIQKSVNFRKINGMTIQLAQSYFLPDFEQIYSTYLSLKVRKLKYLSIFWYTLYIKDEIQSYHYNDLHFVLAKNMD